MASHIAPATLHRRRDRAVRSAGALDDLDDSDVDAFRGADRALVDRTVTAEPAGGHEPPATRGSVE